MLGWMRGAILGAILLGGFAACGGDDFSSEGTGAGGSDASTGGASGGSGGSAGTASGGSAGVTVDAAPEAPIGNCQPGLEGQTCQQLSTPSDACTQCGQQFCCSQVDACLANAACAQAMRCYLDHCFGQPASSCMIANCQPCILAAVGPFTTMSGCLLDNCGGSSGPCPEFQQ